MLCVTACAVLGATALTTARPTPFAVSEADEDRAMTFDEESILFELTAHAAAVERGEGEAHRLSAHTRAWMESQMIVSSSPVLPLSFPFSTFFFVFF